MTQPTISFKAAKQHGNATIYVLIVVALFAALSLIVSRQNDASEGGTLDQDRALIVANQVMSYPLQVKQAIEMMTFTGTEASDLEFMLPGETGFDSASDSPATRIFHPEGGGLVRAQLPEGGAATGITNPPGGWYLGRFNNIEWSATTMDDVVLVAYGVTEQICGMINEKLNGSTAIPSLGDTIPNLLIDDQRHTGTNIPEFTTALCPACEDQLSLCVGDTTGTSYGFYSVILSR